MKNVIVRGIPDDLYEAILKKANKDMQSVNKEIILMLMDCAEMYQGITGYKRSD